MEENVDINHTNIWNQKKMIVFKLEKVNAKKKKYFDTIKCLVLDEI